MENVAVTRWATASTAGPTLVLLLLGIVLTPGCTDTRASARKHAVATLRSDAEDIRAYADGMLREGRSGADALQRLKSDLPAVIDGRVGTMDMTWDAVLVAKGSDGGGGTFYDVALRACVRYTAQLDREPRVTWTSVDCPRSLDGDRRFGPYDETIVLTPD